MFKRTLIVSVSALAVATVGCVSDVVAPVQQTKSQPVEIVPAKAQLRDGAGTPCTLALADLTGDGFVDAADVAAYASLMRADLNTDGYIDAGDVAALAQYFGSQDTRADFNGDGFVDASDIAALAAMRDRADIDRDGSVSPNDLKAITERLGQEVTEPCPA